MCSVQIAECSVLKRMCACRVESGVCSMQSEDYSVQYTVCSVQCAKCSVQCAVGRVQVLLCSGSLSVQSLVCSVFRGQTDFERYTWKGATYALPNTKHSLPNME